MMILEGKVEGKRSRGCSKATWLDNIKDWTGLSIHAAIQRAKDHLGDILGSWLPPTLNLRKALGLIDISDHPSAYTLSHRDFQKKMLNIVCVTFVFISRIQKRD